MYPEPTNIWESIEYSKLGTTIAESTWMFPTIETAHVIALVTVLGTIAIVDLRLVGLANKQYAISKIEHDAIRWTWGAFILAAITGSLLFVSKATSYMANPFFLWKMGIMVLAGLNMFYFNLVTSKTIAQWDTTPTVPTAVRVAGWLSLIFWTMILFFGRAIGFTLGIFGN